MYENENQNEIENYPVEEEGGFGFLPFLLGFAAGVVATVAFATYANDKFNAVVRQTRSASDKVADTAVDLSQKVADRAKDAAGTAQKRFREVREQVNV